jgi:hypothetical protein
MKMHKENCYLLLEKSKLNFSKAEILKYVKNGSDSPNDCYVSMSAAQAQSQHYDFVRYCDQFVMFWGKTSYAIVYAPQSYMSYLHIKFSSAINFSMTVIGKDFITAEVASMLYEHNKSRYASPVESQIERMKSWREKIDLELDVRAVS